MNGVHDLGGMHGLGPIAAETNEPVFHEEWERRVFALFVASFAGGHYSVDEFRYGIETMAPAEYLQSGYYEHWLHAIEALLVERGVLTEAEIVSRMNELKETA